MHTMPQRIGRYEIKSRIGRGGMGDLYLAHDPNTNRLIALKLLNATLDSSELRERFAREARALAALNHPNIVNIYDTGEFEDSPFIVMEYVRGETLAEMIKRRAVLTVSQKLKLIEELCAGLAQAHEIGIIHRDIKPANLMVDQQGRLKILDFGIARVADSNRTRAGLPLTQVNMMIGTPGYMSPEQIEGGEVDHRSDIFAVGAVCYELMSYGEAFAGTNTLQIEAQVRRGQPLPLASVVPGLDPDIDEIVLRALKRDPNKRYQDAGTFERALARLRVRLDPDGAAPLHRPTPPPPNGRATSREARAEAAYQRALAVYRGGSRDAARRSAVEALAEDPSHAGARALLAGLDHRAPVPETSHSPAPRAPAQLTEAGTSVGGPAPTIVSTQASVSTATIASTSRRAHASIPASASAPTILVSPDDVRAPGLWKRCQTFWERRGPFKRRHETFRTRNRKRRASQWMSDHRTALIVALLVGSAGVVAAVILLAGWVRPSGQLLTITQPVGGTLSAAGIKCGTHGSDCLVNRPKGESIELTPEADAGFIFVGYTGDCAPGGRTVMTSPRTCGATFEAVPAQPPETTHMLTISPVPTGGTLEGIDILCGSKRTACSANYPDGQMAYLHPQADDGYTFMKFTGDCSTGGQTQMAGPRTCGAVFSPIADAAKVPPVTQQRSGGARRDGRNKEATPSEPATEANNPPPVPPPAPRGEEQPLQDVKDKPVVPPPSDEEYAKGRIQEVLKEYCDAQEALDPDAVQRVFPTVNIAALRLQLNSSKYKSVQCKFADPIFLSLDASAGKAKVQAAVKRVYEHTAVKSKPETDEMTAVMTLSRSGQRNPWLIDAMQFKPK
jgi:serine/threonine protein kinase